MEPQEKEFLSFMFQQNYNQWISEYPEAKDYEKDYAQNVIIHELVWRIKSIGTEMGDFINHEIQEAHGKKIIIKKSKKKKEFVLFLF